jgi:magnesium chelatase subunit D
VDEPAARDPEALSPAAPTADARAQDALLAAALLAVDPQVLGGVRLQAQAGPARDAWLAALLALLPAGAPWRRLPQHASDDRLLGGIDLPATLAAGRPVLQQGVLAAADGGTLLVAMAERLSAAHAAHLCAALDQHAVRIERDGITAHTPTRFVVVALDEALPDDTPLSPALADRLALWLDLTPLSHRSLPAADAELQAAVQRARDTVAQVQVGEELVQALCAATLALGVDAPRAAWFAVRAARASAALFGRSVAEADDAALAARLVLGPRATRQPVPADEQPPPDPPADPPEQPPEEPPDDAPEDQPPPDRTPQEVAELQEQVIAAATAAIPAGLLARLASGETARDRRHSAGRVGASSASRLRGRPLGARRGAPQGGARLHLIATLRAAAPWQRARRQLLSASGAGAADTPRVLVRADDFHVRRFEQRRTTTTLFAVDASGSSALYRLAEAKGAVELLLAECYVRRDQVAVLTFRGQGAELLLPPTRSLVRAKRALAGMPGGGGTPLAAGLDAVAQLADQVRRSGSTPVVVVLTDGRANVARNGEGGRTQAAADALQAARALRARGGHVLLVDTSVRPEPAALALAVALGARYLALPQADAQTLSRAVHGGPGGTRGGG